MSNQEENFKLSNLQPDKLDTRDKIFVCTSTVLPSKVDYRSYTGEIENQYSTGSCVANATVSSLELLAQRNGVTLDLSRLFLYYTLREPYSQLKDKDQGSYLRDGFKMCNKIGIPEEKYWDFLVEKVNTKPSDEAYSKASENKVLSYNRIVEKSANTVTEVKTAIANGFQTIIAIELDKSFYYLNKNISTQNYAGISKQQDVIGSHAMTVIGYDDELQGFILENSWGQTWGDKGCCLIPYEVFLKDCHDIWVCTGFNDFKFDVNYTESKYKKYFNLVKNFTFKYWLECLFFSGILAVLYVILFLN